MKAIVYTSKCGHTAEYAGILGKLTGLPVYSLKDAERRRKTTRKRHIDNIPRLVNGKQGSRSKKGGEEI